MTPAQRLAIALAAVHAARPRAIRELTLDDIDLPGRTITLAGHRQRLGELTRDALLAWLGYRRLSRKYGSVGDLRVFRGSGGIRVFVDQAARDGFSADLLCVDVGHGGAGSVTFIGGTRWAMP